VDDHVPINARSQEDQHQDRTEGAPADPKRRRRMLLLGGFGLLVVALCLIYSVYYLTTGRYVVSTDDAYTQADGIAVSSQVAGYIDDLLVTDNQMVAAGQPLARIDDRTYRAAVDQATAALASAKAQHDIIAAQIDLQRSQIAQAEARVTAAAATQTLAADTIARQAALRKIGTTSVQAAQQAETNLRAQQATVEGSQAALDAARKQLNVLLAQQEAADAGIESGQAALAVARINLSYATITAPIAGAVGNRSARLGLFVQPGTPLMTVMPMRQAIYVVANFKETDVTNLVRGEHARIDVDAFPDVTFAGTVDSLAPGSGAQFTLLPPENATGNFTKIVQRVPVKILLASRDPVLDRLRPGLSVEVTIDTRTAPPGPAQTLIRNGQQ
jgi:membrane fusion protein (multidrug efflux system)